MNIQTVILFLACLLFSGFNFVLNAHVTNTEWLKKVTIIWGLASLFGAAILLVAWFILILFG